MNKSPINYLLTGVFGAILWVIFAIFMGSYLSENPSLAEKYPEKLAEELRIIFGLAVLSSIAFSAYWYHYGSQERVAGELPEARNKWRVLFFVRMLLSVGLTIFIVVLNLNEGIEASWFIGYFGVLSILTYILFWVSTFFLSPRTVKYIPFGK